jgi:hypothetical protein
MHIYGERGPNTGGVFLPVFNKKHKRAPSKATLIKTRHFSLNLFSVILLGLAHSSFVHSLEADNFNWRLLHRTKSKSNPSLPQTAATKGADDSKGYQGVQGNSDLPGECVPPAEADGSHTDSSMVNDQRSHADPKNANYAGTSPLHSGLWQLVSAASSLPTKSRPAEDTQEETESFTVPPFLMKLLLSTCLLGAALGVICTLAVQKLGRVLSKQTWTRLPTGADRPLGGSTLPDHDFDTSGLLHAPEESRESRLPNNRQTLTEDAEVQTKTPWTTPVPTLIDTQCVWVSGAGERFHLSQNCRGLRTARQTFCKTRCLVCG